jgi:sarcosine oxidase
MTSHYDVIVAGLGGMGTSVLYHLASRGQRVLGLDRFDLGHAMGSSHGLTRIIRLGYFEGPQYVPMLKRAHALWQETGARAGMKLMHVTGSLDIAPEGDEHVQGALRSCLEHDLTHEVLGRREIERRCPAFALTDRHIALFQPDGGFVASEKAIFAHAGLALAAGAEIRTNEPMLDWRATAHGGVEVRTAGGTYTAGRLVLAAGAWMRDLLPGRRAVLNPVRQAIGWFATRNPALFHESRFPVFILTVEEGNFYGFPLYEHPGVKIGGPHYGREPIDPDSPDRTPSAAQVSRMRDFLKRYMPAANGEPLTIKGCLYTVTPDEHFIIDQVPGVPQAIALSPCSGHGFKFASVIGEIAADLATDRPPAFDLSNFAFDRFASVA